MSTLSTTVQDPLAVGIPGHGPIDPGGGMSAADVWAMLVRRAVLATFLFVLFSALAIGGFAAWWLKFPGYRSESLIECVSNIPDTGMTIEQERLKQDEHERFVMSQALLLKSPSVLQDALRITAVRETDWYRSVEPGRHLLELTEELSATPVRGTNFLRVSIECHNPKDASTIVNQVVSSWYSSAKKRSADQFTDEALVTAQGEMDALENEIGGGQERLRLMAARLPAGARLDPAGNMINQQVREYAVQVAQLELELSQLAQYRAIYNDPAGVAITAEDRMFVELDPEVSQASQRLFLLEQQRAADANVYGAEHSVIKQIEAQIAGSQSKLDELRAIKLAERRADIREATNTAYENTRHALLQAREHLAKEEASLQDQDRLLLDYATLEAEVEQRVEYRKGLDEYIKGLQRIKDRGTAIKVNIAQSATDPLERSSPSVLLIPAALFAALALAVGIALALELMDTSVRTSQDITRHLEVAMLGLVPHTDDEELTIRQVESAVRDAPRSMVAEAFRGIRTNLHFSAPPQRQRTVLVTSPRPDDGKTTVACNLAMAIAQGGRRVLLIDANFRRPHVAAVFGHKPGTGLSNILVGDATLAAHVIKTDIPGLDVLHSGPTPPNPVELLGGEPCRKLLEDATAQYDRVIIDSAPVLLASDALVLGPAVDGIIVVVRAKRSSRGAARRACLLLADVGAQVLGAVLNAAQVTRGGYFREQLRAYYDYQTDTPDRPAPTLPSKKDA